MQPFRMSSVLSLLVLAVPLLGGENPQGDYPRLGGMQGQLRSRIRRAPSEAVETPDVITLKGGRKREAYFLSIYGDRLVYYVPETNRSWLKEEVQRSEVETIDFETYLPNDPILPLKIERAAKQPSRKDDILSGVFTARQGRHIEWMASFQSEIDKYLDYSEDATDCGSFDLQSKFVDAVDDELPEELIPQGGRHLGKYNTVTTKREAYLRTHAVKATGKYYLLAPGAVHNKDWVLVLASVIQTEVDHQGRETSLFTTSVPDETFILYFSLERRTFELAWSTVGGGTWGALVGLRFERRGRENGRSGAPELRTTPVPAMRRLPQPSSQPSGRWAGKRAVAEKTPGEFSRRTLRSTTSSGFEWRTDGWKRPAWQLSLR